MADKPETNPWSPETGSPTHRASSKPNSGKKKTQKAQPTLKEIKQEGRSLRSARKAEGASLYGMMNSITREMIEAQPTKVGIIYDDQMLETECLWDPNYPEKPDRLKMSYERCKYYGLIERCKQIPARIATEEDILTKHSKDYVNKIKLTESMSKEEQMELAKKYDGVYFHKATFRSALMAAGSAMEIVEQVVQNKIKYGFGLVRPPGHHAQKNEACGYCIFNNVAIAAEYALENLGLDRIVIVDWDLHHGQGTQYMFYNDPRVIYFSIHRYEFGAFWPNLRESDYDYLGKGRGRGFNINVPFNKVGMTNGDYMAIMQQVLMPILYEFSPQLIIVSNGYDAALGDPEGLCEVTPACYAHFIEMMKTFGGGKLAVIFEGGYCLKSLAEGVALSLKCLLGDPCPRLLLQPPMDSTIQSILHCIRVLRPYWKCFPYHDDAEYDDQLPDFFQKIEIPKKGMRFFNDDTRPELFDLFGDDAYERHPPDVAARIDKQIDRLIEDTKLPSFPNRGVSFATVATRPIEFEIIGAYPKLEKDAAEAINDELDAIIQDTDLHYPPNRTCMVYDEKMRRHKCSSSGHHPERPDRISRIFEMHEECGLVARCKMLQSRVATTEEILLMHSQEYIDEAREFQYKTIEELHRMEGNYNSIYLSQEAYECAALAVGSTLNVVDEVMGGQSRNGVAIVRPPGHHAEPHAAMGFCFFNNVAIAARYAQNKFNIKRVLILDWDVHHGNGTQHMFEDDPSVLYISIHRHDNGWFFPVGEEGNQDHVGVNEGEGFNINIPWNKRDMGDAEYIAAFLQVVMPVAYEFSPELVLVSAGFDAARGDPLGGCRVGPECYGHMTHMLSQLAGGRVVVALEGGYNLYSISESLTMVTSVLLGDMVPPLPSLVPCASAAESIKLVLDVHQKYWQSLQYRVVMPTRHATKVWLGSGKSKKTQKEERKPGADGDAHGLDDTQKSSDAYSEADEINQLVDLLGEVSVSPMVSGDGGDSSSITSAGGLSDLSLGLGAEGGTEDPLEDKDNSALFAVTPLTWCPHLEGAVLPVPLRGISVDDPCLVCKNIGENWVCLTCYEVLCSRYVHEHMLHHTITSEHHLVLSYADLSVWCYACDNYVHNEILLPVKTAAQTNKFGEA